MHRRRGTREVVDLINLQQNRLNDVVANELEPRVPEQMHQVLFSSREEIVDHDDVVTASDEFVDEVAPDEARAAGDDDSLPPAADPDRNAARARPCAAEAGKPGSREECVGRLGWAHAGESGLDDEEGGADEDADEDEQEALLAEEVVDGSGERSGVLDGFGGVGWALAAPQHLFLPPVIQTRLLVELFHDPVVIN